MHKSNIKKPNFEKTKDYINAKTLVFLEQHKELLALMLEEVYFHNEDSYWHWFSENGNIKTYQQVTDKLAADIDNIINKYYEMLLSELPNSLTKYYNTIDPKKEENNYQVKLYLNAKAVN